MKIIHLLKVLCGALLITSHVALAEWTNTVQTVTVDQSRMTLDRVKGTYLVYLTITNSGTESVEGPFRVLIENATLPVAFYDDETASGIPYMNIPNQTLAPEESIRLGVRFEKQRVRLAFDTRIQNDVDNTGWTMVWNDEFEGGVIDESKWTHAQDCNGGGNFEKQCYTDNPDNAYIDNGVLKLVAKPESGQPLPYSSAKLVTKGKADWTYGRFEIRAKAPRGQGAWPAIWMLPTDEVYGGWPHSGEIDIFEAVNLGVPVSAGSEEIQTDVYGTLHYGKSWPDNDESGHNYVLDDNVNPADDFHVYAFEWEEGEMRWYVDGELYATQRKSEVAYDIDGNPDGLLHRGWYTEANGEVIWNSAPFDEKFHLILNFAVGGSWPEAVNLGGVDASAFHANNAFEIDYVRVYECAISPANGQGCATVTAGYDELIQDGGTLQQGAAPIPVPPSDGIAEELTIFAEEINQSWPAWDCCGGSTPTVVADDAEHGNVVEFAIGSTPTVVGFNTTVATVPDAYDGSPMLANGVLEFDLKLVNPPDNAGANWNLKVEQAGAATEAVVGIDTPTTQWQHYSVPLRNLAGAGLDLNGIDVVMIFPDWGQGEGAVFRVDNMVFKEGNPPPPDNQNNRVLLDFEQSAASYAFANFEGGVSTIINNPDKSGINTSDQVVQMQKFAGAPWGGSTVTLEAPVDVDNTVFSIKVWSERAVNVLFKLEGLNVERSVAHSGSGWEQLSFDFSGEVGAGVSQVTLIFDLGVTGDAEGDPANWTFYYDDLGVFEEPELELLDFEQSAGAYNFVNFDGGVSTIVANPQSGGINTSAQVVQMQKFAAQIWGGSTLTLPAPIDVDGTVFTMKVWSSRAVDVLFKLEGMNVERNVTHSGSGWEELSFDFSGDSGSGVTQVTVIFDLGINGDAGGDPDNWTFYYDDIAYPSEEDDPVVVEPDPDPAGFLVDFESAANSYAFVHFDGGVATVIPNPENTAENSSTQVAQMQKFAGAPWGGATLTLPAPLTVDNSVFTIKVWSDRAVDVLFKLEGLDTEQNVAHSGTGWEVLTFDFTGVAGTLAQTTFIFDLGITGNADADPANWTFYFDDIKLATGAETDPDTDGDGVPDSEDLCSGTTAGAAVDAFGCPLSSGSLTGIVQDSDTSAYFYVNTAGWADVHYSINGGGQQNVRMENTGDRNIFALSGLADGDEISYWFTYLQAEGGATDSPLQVYVVGQGSVGDEDNDGVNDNIDQCPGTAPGEEVDEVGCALGAVGDEDADGVTDDLDQCPGTEAGTAVDAVGCALPVFGDQDGDGVADNIDQCPATPVDTPVDALGCDVIADTHEVSSANNILVGGSGSARNGFALYVFDNDQGTGSSVCYGECAENWPPLLVTDGSASGIAGLSVVTRDDGSLQAAHHGRPLYFYAGDITAGDTLGEGLGGVWWTVEYAAGVGDVIPLYHQNTLLEPATSFDRGDALVTRFADRGRDRHAKEDQFQIYDHYLSHYWTHRTARIQFEDYVAKGGSTIDVTFISEWKLGAREFRVWYRGLNTVAEYHGNLQTDSEWPVAEEGPGTWDNDFNKISETGVQYKYTTKITKYQGLNWQPTDPVAPLEIGQRMEVEISQFLDGPPEGRANYYGTTYLYIVGEGIVPWKTVGDFDDKSSEREDSYPIDEAGWLGGATTLPYNYTNEPDNHFMQMATNLSHINGQTFVLGRRLFHTSFDNGQHDESPENGVFSEMANKAGEHYINASCIGCHERNGRAAPEEVGVPLDKWVFRMGDANGEPDPLIGRILQPKAIGAESEGSVSITAWVEEGGLRSPVYQFSQGEPATFSARIAPQLVGLGLLEAVPEATILAREDVHDADGDGISGKAQRVTDPLTGDTRLGRFGWKAGKVSLQHQIADALNSDMGVTTSVLPDPDCGALQSDCGDSGVELDDQHLEDLVKYTALLGVRAQRDLDDPQVQLGQQLFSDSGCAGCHTPTLQTSEYHPLAELRGQTIHPYTDLLLHDMGPGLADNLGEGQATGAEWRTTPLWGIGLSACVTGGVINPQGGQGNEVCDPNPSYLHDGRARTIEEAILWHGGEAELARNNYQSLSASDKSAILSFLNSL